MQRFYHVTSKPAAESVLREGLRDGEGTYMTDAVLSGVWVSDRPLDANEGAWGENVLQVIFPDCIDLSNYEVREEGGTAKGYREWLIPAAMINTLASVTLVRRDPQIDATATTET